VLLLFKLLLGWSFYDSRFTVINCQHAIFNFNCTFGRWIIRCFLGIPSDLTINVVDIKGLAFSFYYPHRDIIIFQVLLIEVEDQLFANLCSHSNFPLIKLCGYVNASRSRFSNSIQGLSRVRIKYKVLAATFSTEIVFNSNICTT